MSSLVANIVTGSYLWGTYYTGSDTEQLYIQTPSDSELYLGQRPLSLVQTSESGTVTTWSTLKFHTLVRSFNPDALAYLLAFLKSPAFLRKDYAELVRKYVDVLQEPVVVSQIKYIVAVAARNRMFNELRKPLTSKSVMNIAYFAETLHYTLAGDFIKFTDYQYNFFLLVKQNSLFTLEEYIALREARSTNTLLTDLLERATNFAKENEYIKPFSQQSVIEASQSKLDSFYIDYVKSL